jgi:TRAP-type C4-dicarboxylate transport system permease small subunit
MPFLNRLSSWLAVLGGLVALGIALMTVVSIVGREWLRQPIQGDFELTQLAMALCVACFLPWCQANKANIMVDFFTTRASPKTQGYMDALGTLLLAIMTGLLAWRTYEGGLRSLNNHETSLLLQVPLWYGYMAMVPGLALSCVIALTQTWNHLPKRPVKV